MMSSSIITLHNRGRVIQQDPKKLSSGTKFSNHLRNTHVVEFENYQSLNQAATIYYQYLISTGKYQGSGSDI